MALRWAAALLVFVVYTDVVVEGCLSWGGSKEKGDHTARCLEPREEGPCFAYLPRVFFNKETEQCEEFRWGGCDANGNNFRSMEECQETCKVKRQQKGPCALETEEVEAMLSGPHEIADLFPPTCDEEGYYTPKQCVPWPGFCKCVDREGQQIGEYFGYMDEVVFGQEGTWEDSTCQCAREAHEATSQTEVVGMFVPRCDWKGDYDRIQCLGSRCYCVDDNLDQVGESVALWEDHLLPCFTPQLCSPVMCEMFCPSGFALDDSGCQVCRCIDGAPDGLPPTVHVPRHRP